MVMSGCLLSICYLPEEETILMSILNAVTFTLPPDAVAEILKLFFSPPSMRDICMENWRLVHVNKLLPAFMTGSRWRSGVFKVSLYGAGSDVADERIWEKQIFQGELYPNARVAIYVRIYLVCLSVNWFTYLSFFLSKEVFSVQYGARFDTSLQILVWEFFSRLEEFLPVPSFSQVYSIHLIPKCWLMNYL